MSETESSRPPEWGDPVGGGGLKGSLDRKTAGMAGYVPHFKTDTHKDCQGQPCS